MDVMRMHPRLPQQLPGKSRLRSTTRRLPKLQRSSSKRRRPSQLRQCSPRQRKRRILLSRSDRACSRPLQLRLLLGRPQHRVLRLAQDQLRARRASKASSPRLHLPVPLVECCPLPRRRLQLRRRLRSHCFRPRRLRLQSLLPLQRLLVLQRREQPMVVALSPPVVASPLQLQFPQPKRPHASLLQRSELAAPPGDAAVCRINQQRSESDRCSHLCPSAAAAAAAA